MEKHLWNPSYKAPPWLQTTFANKDCGVRLKAPRNLLVACHPLDMPQIRRQQDFRSTDFANPLFHTTPGSGPLISSGFGSLPQQTKPSHLESLAAQHQAFHSPRRKSPFAVLKTPMPCCLPSWVKTSQTLAIENQSVSEPSSRQHTLAHLAM